MAPLIDCVLWQGNLSKPQFAHLSAVNRLIVPTSRVMARIKSFFTSKSDPVTPQLGSFHWLPVVLRIEPKLLSRVYKALCDPLTSFQGTRYLQALLFS